MAVDSGVGVRLGVGIGVGEVVGTGIGLLGRTSIFLASVMTNNL